MKVLPYSMWEPQRRRGNRVVDLPMQVAGKDGACSRWNGMSLLWARLGRRLLLLGPMMWLEVCAMSC